VVNYLLFLILYTLIEFLQGQFEATMVNEEFLFTALFFIQEVHNQEPEHTKESVQLHLLDSGNLQNLASLDSLATAVDASKQIFKELVFIPSKQVLIEVDERLQEHVLKGEFSLEVKEVNVAHGFYLILHAIIVGVTLVVDEAKIENGLDDEGIGVGDQGSIEQVTLVGLKHDNLCVHGHEFLKVGRIRLGQKGAIMLNNCPVFLLESLLFPLQLSLLFFLFLFFQHALSFIL